MATQRFSKRFASLKKSRKYRDRARPERESKRLQLETLEDRRLMALVPPVILPNSGVLLNDGAIMNVAPKDLNFEFNDVLDVTTIANGIRLIASGKDGVFSPPGAPTTNDIAIVPGFIGLGDDSRQVVMRFSAPLADDVYRIEIVGAGATPLRDSSGAAFNAGVDYSLDFRLDLGAQIVAIVPQPVRRLPSGQLSLTDSSNVSTQNKITVYFNDDDLVDGPTGAENPNFYKLYVTRNTLDPADDLEFTPTAVTYDPATDSAVLTFGQFASFDQFGGVDASRDAAKSFRLRVGTTETRRASTVTVRLGSSDPGSSFAGALDIGNVIAAGTQGASAQYAQTILDLNNILQWPGDGTEPGHRDIPAENHYNFGPGDSAGITTRFYNFQNVIGSIPDGIGGSQPAFNLITENQKQRAREIFELYGRFAGIQFVESAASGLTIATGDLRVFPGRVSGPGGVIGVAGGGLAVMDNAEVWNDQYGIGSTPPGFSWFDTAMHEIGHLLGQGHTYDLPPHTIQGEDGSLSFLANTTPSPAAEPIFPGDADIVHIRNQYRPESKDIDMYKFTLDGSGVFTAETFAERLSNSSNLDTHITVWREDASGNRELIARNDDYFSKDSFLKLDLGAGVYYVGVSASGNHYYDPTINDSGIGGTTQGDYEVKFDFRKTAGATLVDEITPANPTTAPEVPDTQHVAFDGDADGTPGGIYNFWFRAAAPAGTEVAGKARTLFVDRVAPNGGNGGLTTPFNEIDQALAAAQPYDIVRIIGNGGADGNLQTLADNRAYQIGFSNLGADLRDGRSLNVPKDVTVMVEAGAIFHMFRSYVSVGSTAPSIAADRSGGALQVLGTPSNRVYFTSNNEGAGSIGLDENTSTAPTDEGDWGGISFVTDLDRADGRFFHEEIGVFLNYVNHADLRWGGGQVNVDSKFQVVTPISMTDSRPTISHNIITRSADSAMSANPDSFEETNFQAPRYWSAFSSSTAYSPSGVGAPTPSTSFTLDYQRVGPDIHGNILVEANTAPIAVNGSITTNTSSAGRTTATLSHTVPAGNDRLLVVSIMTDGNTDVSSVTYGGVALTQALENDSGLATGSAVEIWYLTSPSVGTANVVVNFAGSVDPSAVTVANFTGVNQTNPIGATASTRATTGTAISASITTSGANSILFGAISAQGGTSAPFTPAAGISEQWDLTTGANLTDDIGAWGGTLAVPAAGTATFAATSSLSDDWALGVVEIRKLSLIGNSTNALFVRTTTPAGDVLEELTVAGRFDDTDIVHVIQENLSPRGTPSGATLEQVAPPIDLVVPTSTKVTATSGPGFAIGSTVQYKVVYVDLLGNEGLASQTISVTVTDPDLLDPADTTANIQLDNLTIPSGDFVGRRLYRRIGATGEFTLVDLLPAQLTTFVDRNLPRSGELQRLRVLATPSSIQRPRLDGSLAIDPAIVVKSDGARIDLGVGANLLAEGVDGLPVVFTSLYDDRYGAGGTFDTPQDNADNQPKSPAAGDWGGIFAGPNSKASIDFAVIAYAGGLNRIEGTFAGFNAIEVHEADVRVANTEFEFNANGSGGQAPADRFGRGANASGIIFVRGAQPVIIQNTVHDNEAAFININVNALNSERIVDAGRQVGSHFDTANLHFGRMVGRLDNNGPLVRDNHLVDNDLNGMVVRGGTLTTEVVMDDTDIVHVIFDGINVPDFHTFGGMRLESSSTESLVVKFSGSTAGITATGRPLEIDDRIGGILQVLGQPGFPVFMTSFSDDSVGAGFTPNGFPQTDTNGDGGGTSGGGGGSGPLPPAPPATGELQVTPSTNAMQLVNAMLIVPAPNGVAIPTATYVGAASASGTYINGDEVPLEIYPRGIIMTSGNAVLPVSNTLPDFDALNNLAGDADLSALIGGTVTRDASILTITIDVAAGSGIRSGSFDFQFGSEEYSEFVGSPFNDVLGAFINGGAATNVIRDSQGNLVSINSGFFDIDNTGNTIDIEYDGMTSGLTARFPLQIGTNVLKIAIADAVDTAYDSGALITNLRFSPQDVGTGGVGSAPVSGEWQGLTIDQWAHDRNVETILELESPTSDGTGNSTPSQAQPLGGLGPQEKAGDETLRLGFTVQGVIGQPSDVDVYSFSAKAGTEIWVDLDRTWHALDPVVELIDNLGNVLARSQDSTFETLGNGTAGNIARRMQKTPPYEGVDYYTTNYRDPGMRLVLPGPANSTSTYHIRVRSSAGAQISSARGGAIISGGTLVSAGPGILNTVTQGSPGVNEVQEVVGLLGAQGTVGSFALTFNGQTTASIPVTATATEFQAALEALSNIAPGDVAVTLTTGIINSWNIEFRGAYAGLNVNSMTMAVNEVQFIPLAGASLPGSFTLNFGAETTASIPNTATAGDVQAALEALNAFAPGDIFVTKLNVNGSVVFTFDFRGAFANQDVPNSFTAVPSPNEFQRVDLLGTPTGGTFTLTFNGQTTAPIAYNATAADVQAALVALSTIGANNVAVTGPPGGAWDVEFRGALANTDVPSLTANTDALVGGITEGAYQAQIRLREVDEFGGSTIRFATIKFAENGIRVLGQPTHSPLAGEHVDEDTTGGNNNVAANPQDVGNLLTSDRGMLSVAGNLSGAGDVDFYRLVVQYAATQGTSDEDWWSTIFDLDYADGFARPNTVISVFDEATGRLVYSSRDSNIADDRPIPTNVADVSDLTRGSSGAADPWIGPVELRQGTYLVAVSGDSLMPSQLEQYFNPTVANPLVRMEPMDTVSRAVEDHIGATGGSNISVDTTGFIDVSVNTDTSSIVPWSLHDVTLFVTQDSGINNPNRTLFRTIDPFSGTVETTIAEFSRNIRDIAMHPRGRLYTYSVFGDTGDNNRFSDAQTGNYIQIDPGTGALTSIGDDTIATYEQDPTNTAISPVLANVVPGPARVGEGIHFRGISIDYWPGNGLTGEYLGFAVGGRDELSNINDPRNDPRNDLPNILYAFNPDTGVASSIGTDRSGNGLLSGAATQIVERGILDTLIDAVPSGTVDAISVVEATLVDAATDATTFQIMDDYPIGTNFPEIPPPPYPEPTRFVVRNGPPGPGNPGTTFEFDAGPEALFNINPTATGRQIRDTQGFTVDGARIEFDTGPVIFVQGGGNTTNYPAGSTLTITDVNPDPLGPGSRAPITQVFEFTNGGGPTIPGAIAISVAGNPSPLQMAQRIATAINGEQANQGMTTQAVPLGADGRRISLTNVAIPTINPNSDSDALVAGAPAAAITIQGAIGGSIAGSVVVRIEESSLQAALRTSFQRVNQQLNPSGLMPINSQQGVSGPAGAPNRVTVGFDGNRINFSGATNAVNVNLGATVFRTVGSQGGITTPAINRVPVPFLAEDDQAMIAQRMAAALQNNGFPAAQGTATAVVISGSTIVSADQPLSAAAQATGGTITGLAAINQTLYAVDDNGGLFRVVAPQGGNARLDYINSATDLVGIEFAALTAGPRHVEDGRYENMLFGIDVDGELYAFDTTGALQPIFASTVDALGDIVVPTSVQTGLTNVHGLAFSNLDYNLFHTTPQRGGDAGHGISVPHDQSRVASPGGSSIYFGFESVVRNNVGDDQHYAPVAGLNQYNLPGGAHGSIETNNFSLLGYSAADNPVLYFNYLLDTEQAGHNPNTPVFMRDSFRVFVGGDDGNWDLVGTNNGNRFAGAADDEFDYAPLRVQEEWDNSGSWRQVRIPLGDFAGRDNLRLRFDFSTAGSMNVGDYTHLNGVDNTPTNGDELRPVEAQFLRDQHQFTLSIPGAPNETFEFDLGYTLIAPNGAAIPDGARFTVDGITFEFDSNNSVIQTATLRRVAYTAASTAQQIAQAMSAAIVAIGASPVQPVIGNRLNLRGGTPGAVTGAALVTLSGPALPANFIEGAPGALGGTRIDIHSGMSRAEVFQAMVPVLAAVLTEGDTSVIKTHNEVISLISYRWVGQTAGPFADPIHQELLGITTFLPGDEFGAFNVSGNPNPTGPSFPGALRGQTNAFEGVYIDDIIIGVTERGEMVTNGTNVTTFTNNPRAITGTITQGDYQLEIRRAAEGGVPNTAPPPLLTLLPQIHTNDRLREGRMLDAPIGAQIFDGQTFSLSDGINTLTFEFNDTTLIPASGVTPGNVRIDYRPSDTAPTIAQRVVRAVNSASVQAVLKLAAEMGDGTLIPAAGTLPVPSTSNRVHLIGAVNIPTTGGLNFVTFTEQYGDRNQFRDQGQIILYGNEISNSAQWGILIDNGARSAADGNTPHQGPVRVLRENNTQRLVPGVVVTNNIVFGNTTGGILFSGDGGVDSAVPFGRIVNNTLYGNGGTLTGGTQNDVGIRVNNGAGPTLMNNIIANFNQGVDVVGATSLSQTVVGGSLYQGNRTNSNIALGGPGDFPITLANNEPLFVNAAVGNFYLKAQSRAIDSSVDSLLDRPALVTVKNPMGIAQSPIIAPDRDGLGQLRVDDPSVATPNGFGLNPFKDRGAIDRVDFSGPNSILVNPQDNDSVGIDLDPAPTVVVLKSQILENFTIRLIDRFDPEGPAEGSDIDDTTVDTSKVRVEVLTPSGPVLQVEGVNYTFSYDTTNNLIRLTPLGGLWPLFKTYRITLDNSAANGIADKAGNILAPNQPDGTHIYTIFLGSAVDFGDAPDTYGTLLASNGPTHQIVGGIHLGATNGAEPDGQPSVGADLDVSDDGVTFGNLQPGGAANSSNLTVVSAAVGKLDGWFDLNQNGTFDPSEHILQGVNLVVGSTLINFTLPNGLRGNTYARFRMTTTGISTPFGPAADGEVEDYVVTMVGPEFQNGTLNVDVNNDGFVSPIDALYIINYLSTWLPIVNGNGFGSIPLPPRVPEFDAPVPVLDPTGGGVPGNGRYIDVNGDGILSSIDAIQVINYITNPPPAPAPLVGEGEGEGESPSAIPNLALASSSQSVGGRGFSSAALLVSPDIVIEERSTNPAPTSVVMDASVLLDSDDSLDLALLVSSSPLAGDDAEQALSLTERLQHDMPFGPLDDSAWDDLLSNLAGDTSRPDGQPKQGR